MILPYSTYRHSIRSLFYIYLYFSFFLSFFPPSPAERWGRWRQFFSLLFHIEEEERREHSGLSSTAERFGPLVPTSVGSSFLFFSFLFFFVVYVLLHFLFSFNVKGVGTTIEEKLGQDGRIAFLQQQKIFQT